MVLLNNHVLWWSEHKELDLTPALITILIIIVVILCYRLTPLTSSGGASKLPPGPRGLPIVGYFPFLREDLHNQFTEIARDYGPIFKLQIGSKVHVVVNTMDLAKVVVRDQDETFANRDPPLAAKITTYGKVIVWSNNSYWRKLRKIFVHEIINNKNLEACRVYRIKEVRKTIKNIYSQIGTAVNINEVSFSTEANVLTSMLWQNSSIEGEKDRDLVMEFQMIVSELVELVGRPNVSDLFPSLAWFDIQGIERKTKSQVKKFDRIFTSIIDDRNKFNATHQERKKDILQVLLDLKDQKNASSLNITQIKTLLGDMMIAGTDTTATTIEWAMAEIMRDHNIMKRAQEELEEIVGINNIVEESHLPKLQYLDAVIKETLRLHPVAPFLVPRTPNQSCIVGGYTVPHGCMVMLNVSAIHRDPRYWDNPLEFNPTRFLANKCDYNGNNLNFFPFGSGRRICPGIPLAEKMVMYVLASLLHSFEWSLPKGVELDISDKFGLMLKKKEPLIIIPSQRLSDLSLYM